MPTETRTRWTPIDTDRLREAMAEQDWTPTSLAKRLSWDRDTPERQQTIAALVARKGLARCENDRFRRIAQVLLVPDEWLRGDEGPFLALHVEFSPELRGSERISLAVSRLIKRCVYAASRDFAPSTQATDITLLWIYPGNQAVWFVAMIVAQLVSPRAWRTRLTTGVDNPPSGDERTDLNEILRDPPPLAREYEDLIVQQVRFLEYALEPWIEGSEELDVKRFTRLASAINPMVGEWIPDGWEDTDASDTPSSGEYAYAQFADPDGRLKPRRGRPRKKSHDDPR